MFHTLPLELREQIYSYVFRPEFCYIYSKQPYVRTCWLYPNHHALLAINRETRVDAGLYLLRNRYFCITCPPAREKMRAILDSFPGNSGYSSLRRLYILKFDEDTDCGSPINSSDTWLNADIALMLQCPNLREVTLRMRQAIIMPEAKEQGMERILPTAQDLIAKYNLGRLSDMPLLERVVIHWTCINAETVLDRYYENFHSITVPLKQHITPFQMLIEKVKECLKAAMKTRGRRVEIVVNNFPKWAEDDIGWI